MNPEVLDTNIDDDDIIQEAPEYSPKSDFSKAEMTRFNVQKCIELRSQEMKAGFWNTKLTKEGMPVKEWKPDTRKQFIASVDALRALLNPEISRDEQFKKFEVKMKEKALELWNYYSYEELVMEVRDDGNTYGGVVIFKKSGRKFMPDVGANLLVPNPQSPQTVVEIRGGWDSKVNAYWDGLLTLYDLTFAQLNNLIDRNNYFKQVFNYG